MKKFLTVLLTGILSLSLVACGSNSDETETNSNVNSSNNTIQNEETDLSNSGKVLVVYFSMPETTNPDNMTQEEDNSVVVIDGEVLGNTQYVANVIQKNTEGDLFRIEPVSSYPTDHETLVDLAKEEQNDDFRPEIKDQIENLEEYDTIFVGYPNWWGDMPMIMYSFFDDYDFSSKTIIPFNTHGGSGFSDTINTISNLEPGATVIKDGFTTSRDSVEESESDILDWLSNLGISK